MTRSSRPDGRLRAQVADEETHCWLCHEAIDYTLKTPHPMSYEMDHVIPDSKGGVAVRGNVRASHRICNTRKGDSLHVERLPRSRDW